jgi:hypothetical protein
MGEGRAVGVAWKAVGQIGKRASHQEQRWGEHNTAFEAIGEPANRQQEDEVNERPGGEYQSER